MMNRTFSILSIMSFMALVIYSLLICFGVLSLIIHLKYIVVFSSVFFTLLSLGLFISRQDVSRLRYILFIILLILPVFTPLLSLISADVYSSYWNLFIGGSIFQIGTGIYALVGGFIKNTTSPSLTVLAVINYVLFLLLAFLLFLDLKFLMNGMVFTFIGGIVSLLSLLMVILRKPMMSETLK